MGFWPSVCRRWYTIGKVEKISSYEAGLDGDDIDDEYFYTEDIDDIQPYLDKGYLLSDDEEVLYKEIIYLNDLQ